MMKCMVVAGGDELCERSVRDRLLDHPQGVELVTGLNVEDALAAIGEGGVDSLVALGSGPELDLLSLLRRAFELHPQLDALVVAPALPALPREAFGLRRVRYAELAATSEAGHLAFIERLTADAEAGRPARSPIDLVDVALLVLIGGRSTVTRLGWSEQSGLLGFVAGQLVHASTERLEGADAFYEMALWDDWRPEPVTATDLARAANVSTPTDELVAEALRLRLELEDWSEWVETGLDTIDLEHVSPRLADWWQRVLSQRHHGVRLVIAHDSDAACDCARRFSRIVASELGLEREWADHSQTGPTFVRLHPRGGGLLSLTCVPITATNRFQFEAFARRAEAVIVCCRSGRESDEWLQAVVDEAPLVIRRPSGDLGAGDRCPALDQLAEMR